ncbi:phosphoglycerate kinase [Borrelia hermsii]|uniref:Phosphoglycerate kinase n=3 Tax=Borrelia hermsii TaxID=140 RepID=PGK_BORHD|nr:phosphoglycerate kinase [Borrelia hermsii]B2S1P1.1 RecName: Full=Phosphoglycerate kinase [Borrelia hermsii DAH]AAX16578.1 phosphoglycerate kinase [Borrelia hermsii DAH]AJW72889.1 phosphoglycerate kinase [Borrelia hermsii CC1]AMR75755.1 Phosphoglycerate kinase [Borrelia hermsii]ANA42878.1 phosphoglycerate kinase [Borrelia hermsii HS1]UCP01096.1 phosphoglycerate kinase [Borrelia hermsii]
MSIKTIKDFDFSGKRALVRCDFNVPLREGNITDDTRIRAALPTIEYLKSQGARVVLMSHLGRPKGERNLKYSLMPVAKRLSELLGQDVKMLPDCIGDEVATAVSNMKNGDVVLLENIRFYRQEEENCNDFAKKLSQNGDIFVNDAFGTAHRAHASTAGLAAYLPAVGGFLMEKEDEFLGKILKNPESPFVSIIGGSKVSSKIAVLESLLPKSNVMVIGGGMAYTFLKVEGHSIGKSLLENEYIDVAASFLKKAKELDVKVILPLDHIVASEFKEDSIPEYVDAIDIPDGKIGMDIGEKTLRKIEEVLVSAKTVIWNGPLGVFEFDSFSKGTAKVAEYVASCSGITVVGGGDSVAAVNKFNLSEKITHVSTGGGASLEYLEGKILPGIKVLEK